MSHIYVSAHEDDDLIFMSPNLAEDLRRLRVTTVYVTAGDAGNPRASYWRGREEGLKTAYTRGGLGGTTSGSGDRTLSVYRSKLTREIVLANDVDILSPWAREDGLEEWLGILVHVLIILRLTPTLRERYRDWDSPFKSC